MSTTVHGEDPDVAEGSSVDPIIAQPLKEQAPSQGITFINMENNSQHYPPHFIYIILM